MQWEYRTLKQHAQQGWGGEFDAAELDRRLNELGEHGWELVSVLDTNLVAVLKRPRPPSHH